MSEKKNIIETFTELAPRYEKTMDSELRELWGIGYQDFVRQITDLTPAGDSKMILDIATGSARIPIAMAEFKNSNSITIGLDITPAMLINGQADIITKGLSSRIHLVCGSGMELPFSKHTFDLVTCALGMHHMQIEQTVRDLYEKIKPGGSLVLVAVSAPKLWRTRLVSFMLRIGVFLYYWISQNHARARAESAAISSIRSTYEWRQILSKAGFSLINIDVKYVGRRFWYPNGLTITGKKGG